MTEIEQTHPAQDVGALQPKKFVDVQYMDIQWLSAYGLTRHNVLEYFYTSPFFDTSSNNQVIRIQGVDLAQHGAILQSMTGIEYVLDDLNTAEPNLFVIREQRRRSRRPQDVDLVNAYYILDGLVFQCPNFLDLLKSRMSKTAAYLARSFRGLKDSVRWVRADGSDDGGGIGVAPGLRAWTEGEASTAIATADAIEDESSRKVKSKAPAGPAHRKYRKTIREFPSFKVPLLDAHDVRFEE
jgi:mediator of RNA polymerase II transcription subunit 6